MQLVDTSVWIISNVQFKMIIVGLIHKGSGKEIFWLITYGEKLKNNDKYNFLKINKMISSSNKNCLYQLALAN